MRLPSPIVYPCDSNTTRLNVSAITKTGIVTFAGKFISVETCCLTEPFLSIPKVTVDGSPAIGSAMYRS